MNLQKEELAKKKSRTLLKVKREPKPQAPESPASPPDEREETFWNTPGAAARTLHFTGDSLLDEEIDINDVSAASFGTPVTKQKVPEKASLHDMGAHASHSDAQPGGPEQDQYAEDEEDEVESVLDEDDATEPTVVLQKVPSPQKPRSPEPEPVRKQERPPEPVSLASGGHRPKVKVTTELERVVVGYNGSVPRIVRPLTTQFRRRYGLP